MNRPASRVSITSVLLFVAGALPAYGQGQDSATWERDLQVIRTLLPGAYNNANQSYFDVRGGKDVRHRSRHVTIEPVPADSSAGDAFLVTAYWDNDESQQAGLELWSLEADARSESVRMRAWRLDSAEAMGHTGDGPSCDLFWRREAAQFRATADERCPDGFATELVLSEGQLWIDYAAGADSDYRLHRARMFECYADIPGVGGGRDEPYDRYGGFPVHDQGGSAWFTSEDGRRLGISLFLVDWPINNYAGVFTRDSLVVYVNEEVDGERTEHGYAFTLPGADRIGINLKWILVNCYMESNEFATPYM